MMRNKLAAKRSSLSGDTIQQLIVLAFFALMLAFFGAKSKYFLAWKNICSMLIALVPLGLITVSEACLLTAGEWDMSNGHLASLSGMLWAYLITSCGMNVWLAFVIALLVGVVSGFCNGFLVTRFSIPAWMASYSILMVLQSLTYIISDGVAISLKEYEAVKFLGQTKVFGTEITIAVVIMFAVIAVMWFLLKYSQLGRNMYVVGGNREAAANVGINVGAIKMFAFILSGVLSALAGLLCASRSATAQVSVCSLGAMNAIAASIVGGASLGGGKANIVMAIVGAMIITGMQSGLNMIGVPSFYQYMVTGVALFLAVLVQSERRK